MKIDSHVHISIYENNAQNLNEAFKLLQENMEKNNIDYAIVIPDNLEDLAEIADLKQAQELIKNNSKFFLLGSPQIIQRGDTEINKYKEFLEQGIIKGIKFFSGHDPYFPTDTRCLPYYELCQNLDVPVLFHTGANSGNFECAKWNDPKYIVEIAQKYPALKIVIAHYFWPELDYCYETTKDIENIYFDISGMADEEVLDHSGNIDKMRGILNKTIEDRPDKVIFGTDWPMCKVENHIDIVKSLNLDLEIENKIFFKNAVFLYKLPV